MKKTITIRRGIIALLFFLANVSVIAQNSIFEYYRLERKARIFKEQNILDSSLVYYMKAIPLNAECPVSVLESALKVSKKIKNDEASSSLKAEITKQKSKFNPEYYKEIKRIFKEDQKVRKPKNFRIKDRYLECRSSADCDEGKMKKYRKILDNWRVVDSTNAYELVSLIGKYGFPSLNSVSPRGYFRAHIILLHFDLDSGNVIMLPIIDSALIAGKIKPKDYAWTVDRRRMNSGFPPLYYHIPTINYENLSAEEKARIDERRASIGLLPISQGQVIMRTRNGFKVKYID